MAFFTRNQKSLASRNAGFAMQKPPTLREASFSGSRGRAKVEQKTERERWQEDCYFYYDEVEVIAFVFNIAANAVAQCKLVPVQQREDGEWIRSNDERSTRVMDAFKGPVGGQAELLRSAALNLQIAGEAYLVGSPAIIRGRPVNDKFWWEFLSVSEIEVKEDGKQRRRPRRSKGYIDVAQSLDMTRLWRRHPQHSLEADCNLRHCLTVAEELLILTRLVKAISRSRMHAGMWLVPSELSFGPERESESEDGDTDDMDPLTREISEWMLKAIENPDDASSLVSGVMRGPAEFLKEVRYVDGYRQLDEWAAGLRRELIKRIGQGLDAPPEVIEGKAGLNQWTGYQIDAQFLGKHIVPLGNMIREFAEENYLRPMLIEYEDMTPEEAATFGLELDTSDIQVRPDESTTALRLYREGAISLETLLRASGYTISDAGTEGERQERLILELIRIAPVSLGPQLLPMLRGFEDIVVDPNYDGTQNPRQRSQSEDDNKNEENRRDNTRPQDRNTEDVDRRRPGGDEREPGTPGAEPKAGRPDTRRGQGSVLPIKLAVSASDALDRAHEKAATRLLNKATKNVSLKDKLSGVKKSEMLSRLSPGEITSLGVDINELATEASNSIEETARRWIYDWLIEDYELPSIHAADEAAEISKNLASNLFAFASVTAHMPPERFENGRVPDELIVQALESTGRTLYSDTLE